MTEAKRLGERIIKLRKVLNWPQEELAFRANINRNYLSDLENGRRNPSLSILVRLSRGLNVSLEFLLKGVYSPPDL